MTASWVLPSRPTFRSQRRLRHRNDRAARDITKARLETIVFTVGTHIEAHDAGVRSGVRDSGRASEIRTPAQLRTEILIPLPGLRRSGHRHRARGGAGAAEWLPDPTHHSPDHDVPPLALV